MCCEASKGRYCEIIQCSSHKSNWRWNREKRTRGYWRIVKSKTYTQSKRPLDKNQKSKLCQSSVKQTQFQNLKHHRDTSSFNPINRDYHVFIKLFVRSCKSYVCPDWWEHVTRTFTGPMKELSWFVSPKKRVIILQIVDEMDFYIYPKPRVVTHQSGIRLWLLFSRVRFC